LTHVRRPPELRNRDFEAAKWIAVIAMTCDHAGKIAFPSAFEATHAIGRLAFPLFAGIVGLRLAIDPKVASKYLRTLFAWAVVSQPIYVLVGRDWWDGNILFTLLLGVAAWIGIREITAGQTARGCAILLAIIVPSALVEYRTAGVAIIPALAAYAGARPGRALLAVGPLGVLANFVPESPYFAPVDLLALLATPVLILSASASARLPRLPKHAFYAYYPMHLYALHRIDLLS